MWYVCMESSKRKNTDNNQLRERGIPIPSGICKVCNREEETPNHALVKCRITEDVWDQVGVWVKAPTATKRKTLGEIFNSLNDYNWPKAKKKAVHAIFLLATWVIWKNRNEKVFRTTNGEVFKMIEEIKEESFQWMKYKTKVPPISWENWIYFSW
ncbi:uncharacterized protein LOC110933828 [Helianthus annuus]|uniref:uncharacterized protein LOC110933828 n=1 Tax=Helianthus annuus TaxID=4232 RepID=UPI000B8F96C6|nr:uncharacterized protein LOC110933828 [Helianthus annuus]